MEQCVEVAGIDKNSLTKPSWEFYRFYLKSLRVSGSVYCIAFKYKILLWHHQIPLT